MLLFKNILPIECMETRTGDNAIGCGTVHSMLCLTGEEVSLFRVFPNTNTQYKKTLPRLFLR